MELKREGLKFHYFQKNLLLIELLLHLFEMQFLFLLLMVNHMLSIYHLLSIAIDILDFFYFKS